MTDQERLQQIKEKWEFFIEHKDNILNTNVLHNLAGSYQNFFDLIWLIEKLEEKLKKE